MGSVNTMIYAEDWVTKLQEMLDEPNKFKNICEVVYSDARVVNNPYLSDASVIGYGRGSPYTFQTVTQTNQSVTINTDRVLPQHIDRADLAQNDYAKQMYYAERQGVLLNEAIETAVYANHANFTDFGAGDISGGTVADTTQITVSDTNIDNIVRHFLRVIRVAAGQSLLDRNGASVVWRAADLEKLEGFMQANGFASADAALKGGVKQGVYFMGVTHYSSQLLAANHVFAAVNRASHVYILKSVYGQVVVDEKDPNLLSGISVTSRVTFKEMIWNNFKPVVLDVNVA